MQHEEHEQHTRCEYTQGELAGPVDMLVGQQASGGPGADDEDREDGKATHHPHLRPSSGRGSIEGSRPGSWGPIERT
jgi:hypothetical protein